MRHSCTNRQASPAKRATARQLIEDALVNGTGAISFQVVHEWMNVALRRLALPPRDAELFLDRFLLPLWRVQPSPDLSRLALSIHRQSGWSWYDSLIVGAASPIGPIGPRGPSAPVSPIGPPSPLAPRGPTGPTLPSRPSRPAG